MKLSQHLLKISKTKRLSNSQNKSVNCRSRLNLWELKLLKQQNLQFNSKIRQSKSRKLQLQKRPLQWTKQLLLWMRQRYQVLEALKNWKRLKSWRNELLSLDKRILNFPPRLIKQLDYSSGKLVKLLILNSWVRKNHNGKEEHKSLRSQKLRLSKFVC